MTRMVKAILIDTFARTVTEVEHDASDYRHIYKLLSGPVVEGVHGPAVAKVDCFEAVYTHTLPEGDALFIDESGKMKGPTEFFLFHGYPEPLAGRALILGSDNRGDTQACKTTLEQAKDFVSFGDLLNVYGQIAFVVDNNTLADAEPGEGINEALAPQD